MQDEYEWTLTACNSRRSKNDQDDVPKMTKNDQVHGRSIDFWNIGAVSNTASDCVGGRIIMVSGLRGQQKIT